jgi:AcrR family transcriptional regulator
MATDGDVSSPAGIVDGGVAEMQRSRIVDATIQTVAKRGIAGTSVGLVIARAKVSRGTFYEYFASLNECLIAILDGALARAAPLVLEAFAKEDSWQDGMRSALAEMLAFFDEEPALARVCLLELGTAAPVVREHRERILGAFAALVLARVENEVSHASPLAAEGTYASVVGIVNARLVESKQQPLLELLGPLMGIIVAPFMDKTQVALEVERGEELAREMLKQRAPGMAHHEDVSIDVPAVLLDPRAHRARRCLLYLAQHPGASNREIATGTGITRHEQTSRLLTRLTHMGLLTKHPTTPGQANAWTLTQPGQQIAQTLTKQKQ